jgi:hypothetical protein
MQTRHRLLYGKSRLLPLPLGRGLLEICLLSSGSVLNPERFAILDTCRINFKRGPGHVFSS